MMNVNIQNTQQVLQKTNMLGFLPQVAPRELLEPDHSQNTVMDDPSTPEPSYPQQDSNSRSATLSDNPLMPSPQQMQQAQRQSQAAAGAVFNQPRQRISDSNIFNQTWVPEDEESDDAAPAQGPGQAGRAGQAEDQQTAQELFTRYNNSWQTRSNDVDKAQSKNTSSAQSANGTNQAEGPAKPKFDTGRLIQLQFMSNAGKDLASNLIMSAAEKAIALKEKFLRNFFRLVDIEYKQFVKSDDAVYSRKNLREILAALGETINPFSAKKKRQEDRDRVPDKRGFNKLTQRLAGRTLKIFDDPEEEEQQQQQQQREPLEVVW